jgi:hypothetical protein
MAAFCPWIPQQCAEKEPSHQGEKWLWLGILNMWSNSKMENALKKSDLSKET